VHISANSCTQTDRQMDGHPHTTTDRSTNLIISSNSLRSIGGDNNDTSSFFLCYAYRTLSGLAGLESGEQRGQRDGSNGRG